MDHDDPDHIDPDDPGIYIEPDSSSLENASIKNERVEKTTNSEIYEEAGDLFNPSGDQQ